MTDEIAPAGRTVERAARVSVAVDRQRHGRGALEIGGEVVPRAADQRVGPEVAVEYVIARAAVEEIRSGGAGQGVVAGPAQDVFDVAVRADIVVLRRGSVV